MNSWWNIILRPLCFLILLGLSSFIIFKLYCMSKNNEHDIASLSSQLRNQSFSEIENAARFLIPLNSSASSLSRTLVSSLNGTELSFDLIQAKVAPSLFVALSIIPYVSHVAYIGLDGLMFSYYYTSTNDDEIFAVFSNSSSCCCSSCFECYTQPVNRDNGKLYGEAMSCDKSIIDFNITFVQEFVNRTNACALLGKEWDEKQEPLFLYNVAMEGRGLISIGYPMTVIADHFAGIEFYGGDFHLAKSNGRVLVESKLKDTRIDVRNGTVSVETVNVKGDVEDKSDYYSCKLKDGELSHFHIKGNKHIFYCSTLEIGGIASVYVLAFPTKGEESSAHKNSILTMILLVLMLAIIVIAIGVFIIMILRSAQREVFLCAALIKQMESTQQAERKSMNKSLAFASASHDIRASLAAITGLIDLCRGNAKPKSELAANLAQMSTCAMDLLGILNSVLDTSKIEAGKMQLEEEEFNVAQLVEDVVDMFYPIGMKKGVDVVLDFTDCSILKFNLVRGDKGKLKQILSNLLSNATKFTSEGHISVRAMVREKNIRNEIIVSNGKSMLNCLSRMCYKNNGSLSTLDGLDTVQEDRNCMEYVFDVDDTGKGIPKDRQRSVFENFVQVKETALGQGTGLGLGIVQSLVRLMGGEIKILDKEQGERGTCFRFNVFLTACHDIEREGSYISDDGYPTDIHHRFGMHVRALPPRSDASHIILLLAGKERRRVTKRMIQSFGLKVAVAKRSTDLFHVLERIKQKMDPPQLSSSEITVVDTMNKSPSNNSNETSSTKDENPSFLLIVVDANAAPLSEVCSVLANFKKDIHNFPCKVVWLENPIKRNDSKELEDKKITPPCDHILTKPLHGSHLYRVLGLLPEFGGAFQSSFSKGKAKITEEIHCSPRKNELEQMMIDIIDGESSNKPLNGKNVLVVEDDRTLCMLSTTILHKLGATLHVCENGKEAFDLVCATLMNKMEGALPFDYIFMDCKMPVMDGFEATRLIRKEEEGYGIHTPIIALTAYSTAEEVSRSIDAGMDFHLVKPLRTEDVLQLITHSSYY